MDKRIVADREIYKVLFVFALVQISVIYLAWNLHLPALQSQTIVAESSGAGYSPLQLGIAYGLYIAVAGTVGWYIVKHFKIQEIAMRIAEVLFIIGGTYFLVYLINTNIFVDFIPGIFIAIFKQIAPWIANFAAILASIGYGIFLAVEIGFVGLLAFIVILALYDYFAVYISKHMIDMADTLKNGGSALLIQTQRRINNTTISSCRLGSADMFVPAGLAGSIILSHTPYSLFLGICVALGAFAGLYVVMGRVQKSLKGFPAIPYILGGIIGMAFIGFIMLSVL